MCLCVCVCVCSCVFVFMTKGGVAVGVAYNKKACNFEIDSCNTANLCRNTHTHTLAYPPHSILINHLSQTLDSCVRHASVTS